MVVAINLNAGFPNLMPTAPPAPPPAKPAAPKRETPLPFTPSKPIPKTPGPAPTHPIPERQPCWDPKPGVCP